MACLYVLFLVNLTGGCYFSMGDHMEKDDVREFLKSFGVLVFDMGDTFMFDCDHFSDNEDLQVTYRSLGGNYMKQDELTQSIRHIYNSLIKIARDEDQYHSFPTISDFLSTDVYFKDFGTQDREIIKETSTGLISNDRMSGSSVQALVSGDFYFFCLQ